MVARGSLDAVAEDLLAAVDAITKHGGGSYADLLDCAARNLIAQTVKIAHLRDNLDMSRLADPTQSDLQRSQKYLKALRALGMSPK